jgi:phosphomannomutase
MIAVTKKCLSVLLKEIYDKYGYRVMIENSYTFNAEDKSRLNRILYIDRQIPDFSIEIEKISYEDGLKVYFKNGGWLVARFSGTEPLLRVFAEMPNEKQVADVCNRMKGFLGI